VVAILKLSGKILSLDVVTVWLYFSMAVWLTCVSALQGWSFKRRPGGFRIITPLFGMGWCCKWGRRE